MERVITQRKPPEVRICKVGAGRTATLCFPTPPSEPGVPLLGHRALQGLATSTPSVTTGLVISVAFTAAPLPLPGSRLARSSSDTKQLLDRENVNPLAPFPTWTAFPPSEYYDASDAHALHRGVHPSPHGPPTFTLTPSAVTFRRWLTSDPSRSSRYPNRSAGRTGLPLTSLRLACQPGQSRSSVGICSTIGCGRCPIRQGLEAGVPFPEVFRHFVCSPWASSAKPRILAACLAPHGYLSGAALSPRIASLRRYAPRAHRLRVQAMEFSTHGISALRGARRLRNQSCVGTRPPSTSTPH